MKPCLRIDRHGKYWYKRERGLVNVVQFCGPFAAFTHALNAALRDRFDMTPIEDAFEGGVVAANEPHNDLRKVGSWVGMMGTDSWANAQKQTG